MFGLPHCTYYLCLMNGSNSDEESSWRPKNLCAICTKKLFTIIDFDVLLREQALSEACESNPHFAQTKEHHDDVIEYLNKVFKKTGYTKPYIKEAKPEKVDYLRQGFRKKK
jgi:hypothetical protein